MKYPNSTHSRHLARLGLSGVTVPVSAPFGPGPNRPYLSPADVSLINAAESATQLRKDAKVRRDRDWARKKLRPQVPFGKRPPLWPKRLPVPGPKFPWFTVAKGLWYMLHTPPTPWELGDQVGSWKLVRICVPPPLDSTPMMVSHTVLGQSAAGPALATCYVNQAGFWDGVTINPGPPWAMTADTSRTRNRLAIQFVGSLNLANRVHSRYHWWRMHEYENASAPPYGGWTGPSPLLPQPANEKAPASTQTLPVPEPAPAPWEGTYFPDAYAPGEVPHEQKPPPIWHRPKRPQPVSSQSPDVDNSWKQEPGVAPAPSPSPWPQPQPQPQPLPVPEGLPEALPEFEVVPVPSVGTQVVAGTKTWPQRQRDDNTPVKPAPPRTKERKTRAPQWVGFLWNAIGGVTEGVDFVEVLYECLPWKLKVSEYQKRGRQPNPAEMAGIIYQNANSLDVGCAITGYIENQLEDMLYAAGSDQIAQANRDWDRPIGFEAGGALTGGGPFVGIR